MSAIFAVGQSSHASLSCRPHSRSSPASPLQEGRSSPLSPQEKQEVEEERQEAASLNEAALSIPDSEADDDAASTYEPANEAVPGDAGVVVGGGNPVDWQGVLGHSASGLGAANAATSAYFNFARTATAFGLNVAKRVTQGLVAVPALLADGALTGTAPGDTSGTPSIAQVAHSGIASFFDTISLVAVGGIDLTSAVTTAGLGAASSGVEGVRRSLGSEVLRSLLEFSKLVKREWNAEDDSLPPGGIPGLLDRRPHQGAHHLGLDPARHAQVPGDPHPAGPGRDRYRQTQERRRGAQADAPCQCHRSTRLSPSRQAVKPNSPPTPPQSGQSDVRITSNQTLSGDAGSVIGAEIGHRDGSSARLPGSTLSDEPARPLSDAEAVHNLQRYSKLVLGVYGGMAL
ncbi:hypothetical protein L1887_61333 [Cichorium endivia]|nr:hypothetical protein L1887_61333 [Cichorium endivia]